MMTKTTTTKTERSNRAVGKSTKSSSLKPSSSSKNERMDSGGGSSSSSNNNNNNNTQLLSQTRICIKNLPPSMTSEVELKEFLMETFRRHVGDNGKQQSQQSSQSQQSQSSSTSSSSLRITDCKILKSSKTGKSRHVAFVGLKHANQAFWAVNFLNKTYVRSCRISVMYATKTINKQQVNVNVKQQQHDLVDGEDKPDAATNNNNNNKKVEDFLNEISSRYNNSGGPPGSNNNKSKFWANDIDTTTSAVVDDNINNTDDKIVRVPDLTLTTDRQNTTYENNSDNDNDDDRSTTSSSSSGSSSTGNSNDHGDDHSFKEDDNNNNNNNNNRSQSQGGLSADLDFLKSKQRSLVDLEHMMMKDDINENNDPTVTGSKNRSDSSSSSSDSSSSSSSDSSSEDENDMIDENQEERLNGTPKTKETRENKDNDMTGDSNDMDVAEKNNAGKDKEDDGDDDDDFAESSSRLFVRNLPFDTTEEELEELFTPFGHLTQCHIPVDDQHRNKGFAFVSYESHVSAMRATQELDGNDFQGRLIHILPARPQQPNTNSQSGHHDHQSSTNASLTWKQKEELKRKENETKNGGDTKSWSTTFVRGDAVIDNLAERLGLRKGDLLGVKDKLSSGDAAVRLALGETKIIEENRQYFREHGVDMDELVCSNLTNQQAKSVQRSRTSILVKNLPFDTRVEELTKLFHVGTTTFKVLLPPSRTIALVEYTHTNDAKKAFRKLAYRRFKHVPIYLEWAPIKAKEGTSTPKTPIIEESTIAGQSNVAQKESDVLRSRSTSPTLLDEEEEESNVGSGDIKVSTIYVKNLNFATTEQALKALFEEKFGKVISVRIPQKVLPSSGGAIEESSRLSMGYGFVELPSHENAKKAVKTLQGSLVDGHALEFALSSTNKQAVGSSTAPKPRSGKSTTKIMVRNVPFQATRKDILKLFGSFGQLKKVRLPKKFDGTHRGFAFVDFLTAKEAQAAMSALSRTHLFGRHLVLEWASDDSMQAVDDLRSKAKRDIGKLIPSEPQNKRIKFA